MDLDIDDAVRTAAFAYLAEQARLRGESWPAVFPRDLLAAGFIFRNRRVPLIGPQGIFKPAVLATIPLSITTAPREPGKPPPYDDGVSYDGQVTYRYRGSDPLHHENVGLRRAMSERKPLIYFYGLVPGRYLATWPAYVTADNPRDLSFHIAFEPANSVDLPELSGQDVRRAYAFRVVRQRLHQAGFRESVLDAYRRTCSLCHLRHEELLDAAHIIPDGRPRGEPVVPNGLALCKLHHAAFDSNIIGIRPDLVLEVREDILRESDGPMLRHGLQGLHKSVITVPHAARYRPAPDRLEERYEEFRRAG